MALQHQPANTGATPRSRICKKEAAFRTHLAVYLGVGLFLFTLNLLTSPFHLWFYWPLFFWGWGLAFHAFATYGAEAPARVPEVLRSFAPWLGGTAPVRPPEAGPAAVAPFAAEAFAAVHGRIERIKEVVWSIEDESVRDQVAAFIVHAERIVAAMARERVDASSVRRFDAEMLAPVASLLGTYVDAARHGVPSADDAARRIAERDLPPLLGRFDAMFVDADGAPAGADSRP